MKHTTRAHRRQEASEKKKRKKSAHRKGHLCNTAEKHLQQAEEEEAGVELTLCYAVGVEVGPQKQGGCNDCHYGCLERHTRRVWEYESRAETVD
jgi:hypothetical protein